MDVIEFGMLVSRFNILDKAQDTISDIKEKFDKDGKTGKCTFDQFY